MHLWGDTDGGALLGSLKRIQLDNFATQRCISRQLCSAHVSIILSSRLLFLNADVGLFIMKIKLKLIVFHHMNQVRPKYYILVWLVESWKGPSLCGQCSWDKCFPHLQACHVGLGAGSLVQDKALGAGRHCGPCSPLLGAMSSGCLLTRPTRTPLEGNAAHSLHSIHLRDTHTVDLLYIYDQTWPTVCLYQ